MKRLILLIIMFFVPVLITPFEEDLKNVDYNYRGWNIPDVKLFKNHSSENVFLEECQVRIKIDHYIDHNLLFQRVVLNKIELENEKKDEIQRKKDTLDFYERWWINSIDRFKLSDSNEIIGYYVYFSSDGISAYDKLNEIFAFDKSPINFLEYTGDGYETSAFLFDLDNDGTIESLYGENSFDIREDFNKLKTLICKVLMERNKKSNSEIIKIREKWIDFLDLPSEKTATEFFNLIEAREILSSSEIKIETEEIKLDKWINTYSILTKGTPEKEKKIPYYKTNEDIKKLYNWIFEALDILENEVYYGNKYAAKILFRLYPYSFYFSHDMLKIFFIIDNFLKINPELFLEVLSEHRHEISLKEAFDGNRGLVYIGQAKQKYFDIQKKIKAVENVKNERLKELKELCLKFLNKQAEYIKQSFSIDVNNVVASNKEILNGIEGKTRDKR